MAKNCRSPIKKASILYEVINYFCNVSYAGLVSAKLNVWRSSLPNGISKIIFLKTLYGYFP